MSSKYSASKATAQAASAQKASQISAKQSQSVGSFGKGGISSGAGKTGGIDLARISSGGISQQDFEQLSAEGQAQAIVAQNQRLQEQQIQSQAGYTITPTGSRAYQINLAETVGVSDEARKDISKSLSESVGLYDVGGYERGYDYTQPDKSGMMVGKGKQKIPQPPFPATYSVAGTLATVKAFSLDKIFPPQPRNLRLNLEERLGIFEGAPQEETEISRPTEGFVPYFPKSAEEIRKEQLEERRLNQQYLPYIKVKDVEAFFEPVKENVIKPLAESNIGLAFRDIEGISDIAKGKSGLTPIEELTGIKYFPRSSIRETPAEIQKGLEENTLNQILSGKLPSGDLTKTGKSLGGEIASYFLVPSITKQNLKIIKTSKTPEAIDIAVIEQAFGKPAKTIEVMKPLNIAKQIKETPRISIEQEQQIITQSTRKAELEAERASLFKPSDVARPVGPEGQFKIIKELRTTPKEIERMFEIDEELLKVQQQTEKIVGKGTTKPTTQEVITQIGETPKLERKGLEDLTIFKVGEGLYKVESPKLATSAEEIEILVRARETQKGRSYEAFTFSRNVDIDPTDLMVRGKLTQKEQKELGQTAIGRYLYETPSYALDYLKTRIGTSEQFKPSISIQRFSLEELGKSERGFYDFFTGEIKEPPIKGRSALLYETEAFPDIGIDLAPLKTTLKAGRPLDYGPFKLPTQFEGEVRYGTGKLLTEKVSEPRKAMSASEAAKYARDLINPKPERMVGLVPAVLGGYGNYEVINPSGVGGKGKYKNTIPLGLGGVGIYKTETPSGVGGKGFYETKIKKGQKYDVFGSLPSITEAEQLKEERRRMKKLGIGMEFYRYPPESQPPSKQKFETIFEEEKPSTKGKSLLGDLGISPIIGKEESLFIDTKEIFPTIKGQPKFDFGTIFRQTGKPKLKQIPDFFSGLKIADVIDVSLLQGQKPIEAVGLKEDLSLILTTPTPFPPEITPKTPIPEEPFGRGFPFDFPFGGAGGGAGLDDKSYRKYFRLYDIADVPFGEVEYGIGYFIDKPYEIERLPRRRKTKEEDYFSF